jgi:hypothetical protein
MLPTKPCFVVVVEERDVVILFEEVVVMEAVGAEVVIVEAVGAEVVIVEAVGAEVVVMEAVGAEVVVMEAVPEISSIDTFIALGVSVVK